MDTDDAIITTDYGDGVMIDEYNGQIGLIATRKGNNDVNYKVWVFESKWNNGKPEPAEKKRPMAVRLGTKAKAIETLKRIIAELGRE